MRICRQKKIPGICTESFPNKKKIMDNKLTKTFRILKIWKYFANSYRDIRDICDDLFDINTFSFAPVFKYHSLFKLLPTKKPNQMKFSAFFFLSNNVDNLQWKIQGKKN